ncbi:alpha/beta fold hydrolase [Nocardioides euryhalodurans]|uniref:alpha/beta fold hydrolase n=1 Tax=Nocardioides euryhalodurans TaxID=2518370 RepID=UPI00142346E8|nr:alpha/beta hydrolase [Nocardioides euryhalodurans]
MSRTRPVRVGEVDLETEVWGEGEPLVVIQTALTADELRPLAEQLAGDGELEVIHYHRRGYAGSGPALRPGSIAQDAADCRFLLEALAVGPAHVVGASYSAAVALTLATRCPDVVRTLTVLEPPPSGVPSTPDFVAASTRLVESYSSRGPTVALDELMGMLAGPDWRAESERDLPGSVAAMERDAPTFFESDLPALLSWELDDADATRITCPVLYVGGGQSGPWFAEVRTRIRRLLPQTESATVAGAGHLLALSHAADTARLVLDFLRRHRSAGAART